MAGGINFCIINKGKYTPNYDGQPDTYNMAELLNGEWMGVEGYGSASGANGIFNLEMTSLLARFHNTLINRDTASTILTGSQSWNIFQTNGTYQQTP